MVSLICRVNVSVNSSHRFDRISMRTWSFRKLAQINKMHNSHHDQSMEKEKGFLQEQILKF